MNLELVRTSLERQLRAALLTLRDLAERYPDDLWRDPGPENAAWQLAYHTLVFGDYYLAPASDQHDHWPGHRSDVQYHDGIPGPPIEGDERPLVCAPYSQEETIAFCDHILGRLPAALAALDLEAPECGFDRRRRSPSAITSWVGSPRPSRPWTWRRPSAASSGIRSPSSSTCWSTCATCNMGRPSSPIGCGRRRGRGRRGWGRADRHSSGRQISTS